MNINTALTPRFQSYNASLPTLLTEVRRTYRHKANKRNRKWLRVLGRPPQSRSGMKTDEWAATLTPSRLVNCSGVRQSAFLINCLKRKLHTAHATDICVSKLWQHANLCQLRLNSAVSHWVFLRQITNQRQVISLAASLGKARFITCLQCPETLPWEEKQSDQWIAHNVQFHTGI